MVMNSDFQLEYVVTQDRDAIRNSVLEYEYRVVHVPSSKIVMCFVGERHVDNKGAGASGVFSCLLIEQHGMVMTRDQLGNIEQHTLPKILH